MFAGALSPQNWWAELDENWKKIFILNLDLEGLFSEKDIAYIPLLTELDCSGTLITDLTPLTYLPALTSLDISDTRILDLSPLKAIPSLRELHATFCYGIDLDELIGLDHLEVLDISYPRSPHSNWESVRQLKMLKEFYGNACGIRSLAYLLPLTKLKVASLHFNYIPFNDIHTMKDELPKCQILG